MTMDHEEIRKRQQKRRQQRQQRLERRKKLRQRLLWIFAAAALLLALGGLVYLLVDHLSQPAPSDTDQTTQNSQTTEPETVIHLSFAGDLNVTDKVVASGAQSDGYDYTNVFMDIVPLFAGSDGAAVNFEGNLCGAPYGAKDTRAPQELMEALSAAGVDFIQMANSCSLNNGLSGLGDTLDAIRQAGMEPLGAYADQEEFQESKGFTLREIHGVKVAFVSFTKGMDSLGLPEGSENCVNLLYTDYTSTYQDVDTTGITALLRAVADEEPDVTIALLHWGSEYNNQISASQEAIVELMQEEGVDAIIGTHSHYVQKIDYDEKAGTLVAYSLGDFFGDGEKSGTAYSIVLNVEITKNNETGKAAVTGFRYDPIYTSTYDNDGTAETKLLRMRQAIADYEANGIGRVSQETYTAMKTALSKLEKTLDE